MRLTLLHAVVHSGVPSVRGPTLCGPSCLWMS